MNKIENIIRNRMKKLYEKHGGFARLDLKKVENAHNKWLKMKAVADWCRKIEKARG